MNRVLVPIDDSSPAWNALEYALRKYEGAPITLLHVVDLTPQFGDDSGMGLVVVDDRRERAKELLAEAAEAASTGGCEVETELEVGNPPDVIVGYARDRGIDHIVIGSHCRTGIWRILQGSVAEAVVRRSPVPVTVVPRGEREQRGVRARVASPLADDHELG